MEHKEHLRRVTRGYTEFSYAPIPTGWTKFLRKCMIYQAWRWLVLNFKILRIVAFGHS